MPVKMRPADVDDLVGILTRRAQMNAAGSRLFFMTFVSQADLPEEFKLQVAGPVLEYPNEGARWITNWAANMGVNPNDKRFTVLGSLLRPLLPSVGEEDRNTILALCVVYKLWSDRNLLEDMKIRYQIPQAAGVLSGGPAEVGPSIDWRASTDEVQLQGFFKEAPPLYDVGFLKRAMAQTVSVCRLEIPKINRWGTGVLIAPDLILTNYHVLKENPDDDVLENARRVALHFGCITAEDGDVAKGQTFKLVADQPIKASSPVGQLDYVLLQVEERIQQAKNIKSVEVTDEEPTPGEGTGINILQHPRGGPMMLGLSSNGVTWISEGSGLIQYVTRTAGGSSGAPCFNDDWKLVALHHAERSKAFGSIREGILFRSIYKEISKHLRQ